MAQFEGGKAETERFLKAHTGKFYVYLLCRPDGRPFYIGKGLNRRVFEHEAEALRNHPIGESNPFKCNVIRKIVREGGALRFKIDALYEPQEQIRCLERETTLIQEHRRLHEGGILTNLAGGLGSMSGSAPFSIDRHSATLSGEPEDNPERATLNRFLLSIGPVASVPIKPVRQVTPILPATPHSNPRSPSLRCAYALIASAAATGTRLTPESTIPRAFTYQGVEAIIENGVARDILKASMASLVSARSAIHEPFRISEAQISLLEQLYGRAGLVERGLL